MMVGAVCLFLAAPLVPAKDTNDYVHYRLGVKYKNEKKFDQAVEEFRKVLAAYPDNYNTYMSLAEIRNYQGRYRLAVYNLKKALSYNPGWGKAKKMLAAVYERDGQYQNAIKELQDYYQYCDPAERDSLQGQVNRLMSIVKYGKAPQPEETEPAVGQTAPTVTAKAGVKKSAPETRKKIRATPRRAIPKNAVAEKEFNAGVAAYQKGVETQDSEQFNKALTHFRTTLKKQPRHYGAYYYAGLIRRRNGQNKMAKINFTKALPYKELGHNAHFYLGKIYGEEKNYTKAIEHLKLYLQQTSYAPGKREAQSLIDRYSAAYNALHKEPEKIDIKALARDEMHREISQIPEERIYTPIEIRIDSLLVMTVVDTMTDPGQAMLKGVKSFQENRFDKAIEDFKKMLVSYPKGDIAARCLYNIGVCYMKLKNYAGAENFFQQVLDRHNLHALAAPGLFLKAMTYLERSEAGTAETLFRKFIQKYRTHALVGKAYEKLGDSYVDLMQDKKSVDAYRQASDKAKSSMDKVYALYKLGTAYFKIGNATRAVESFQNAIVTGEKHGIFVRVPDSYYKIADHYYKQKDNKKALDYYLKATRKYPAYQDTPWGLFQIGSIYKNLKKHEKAIKTFNTLIHSYPDDYWARQAQWKLEDTVWEHEYRAVLK